MMQLTIPRTSDPFARFALIALVCSVIYLALANVDGTTRPAQAQDIIIYEATPTPALPIADPPAPALAFALPTPTAQPWIDTALGAIDEAADAFADDQAAQLAREQVEAARIAAEQLAQEQYLANVGAQAAHSPRGDVQTPPSYDTGPVEVSPGVIIDPQPAPAPEAIAVAAPRISVEQAAIIGQRESNGCASGEVFYPRTGCHLPGSAGAMPGAVGEP